MIFLDDLDVRPKMPYSPMRLDSLAFSRKVLVPRAEGAQVRPIARVRAVIARQTPTGVELLIAPADDERPWVVAEDVISCSPELRRDGSSPDSLSRLLIYICSEVCSELLIDRATLDFLAGQPPAEASRLDEVCARVVAALFGEFATEETSPEPSPEPADVDEPEPEPEPLNLTDLPLLFSIPVLIFWLFEIRRLITIEQYWSFGDRVPGIHGLVMLKGLVLLGESALVVYGFWGIAQRRPGMARFWRQGLDYLSGFAVFEVFMFWYITVSVGRGFTEPGLELTVQNTLLFLACRMGAGFFNRTLKTQEQAA